MAILTLQLIAASYIVTALIASSHIMQPARWLFRYTVSKIPGVRNFFLAYYRGLRGLSTYVLDDETSFEPDGGWDFISCRMCLGFWVSLALVLYFIPFHGLEPLFLDVLTVYGASYMMAKLEQP